jgi:hypothetical protein
MINSPPPVQASGGLLICGLTAHRATPATLPAVMPTHCEFVINTKTARALGLQLAQSLVLQATELIN